MKTCPYFQTRDSIKLPVDEAFRGPDGWDTEDFEEVFKIYHIYNTIQTKIVANKMS